MSLFLLCIFALVPYHNVAVHDAEMTVFPDFSEVVRFENHLNTCKEVDRAQTFVHLAPPKQESEEEIPELEPEVVPETEPLLKTQLQSSVSEVKPQKQEVSEPATMEFPEDASPIEKSVGKKVEFASAQEPIPNQVSAGATVLGDVPIPNQSSAVPAVLEDVPIRRPWGVLTFTIFLFLLSLSANVFLGWQLVETRRVKINN